MFFVCFVFFNNFAEAGKFRSGELGQALEKYPAV